MRTNQHENDNVVEELDQLKKDPRKWHEFMALQAEKALRHWPGRKRK